VFMAIHLEAKDIKRPTMNSVGRPVAEYGRHPPLAKRVAAVCTVLKKYLAPGAPRESRGETVSGREECGQQPRAIGVASV
jgi:hypothetical protein